MTNKNYNARFLKASVESRRRELPGNSNAHHIRFLFTRFLARFSEYFKDRVILKGGFALETRLDKARTTRDIDLLITGSHARILDEINEAGSLDLGDFMRFEVSAGKKIKNVQYEGQKFKVRCMWGNEVYGHFTIDISFGQTLGKPDLLKTINYLEFAEFPPAYIYAYPIETHIAEKLHAYSMPHSTRIKDFPDIALLASIRPIRWDLLRTNLDRTFNTRDIYPIPKKLPSPPEEWKEGYERMAVENDLEWKNMEDLSTRFQYL